jgi:hypothetical protein
VSGAEFKVATNDGDKPALVGLSLGSYQRDFTADPERWEWFVPIF